jgi:hypothetical protein
MIHEIHNVKHDLQFASRRISFDGFHHQVIPAALVTRSGSAGIFPAWKCVQPHNVGCV